MKATVITIAIIVSMLFSSTNIFGANDGIYKTETMDEATNTLTVTLCKGENGSNLTYHKKHTIQYNEDGKPIEKIHYSWNGFNWETVQKYNYEYDATGQLTIMTLKYWDKNKKEWTDKKVSQLVYPNNDQILVMHTK